MIPSNNPYEIKKHGLYERSDGSVSLKCDKTQEGSAFADKEPHFNGMTWLRKLSSAVPSHIIWGKRHDFVWVINVVLVPIADRLRLSPAPTRSKPHSTTLLGVA